MVNFRVKFKVSTVTLYGYSEDISLYPVVGGSDENESYYKATPSGKVELSITNPNLHGKIKPGMEFYIDFSEADSE